MKILFSLLLLFSVSTKAAESACSNLFSNYPFPKSQPIEPALLEEARKIFTLTAAENTRGFLRIRTPRVVVLPDPDLNLKEALRRLDETAPIYNNMLTLRNFLNNRTLSFDIRENLELRLDANIIGILLRTSDVLAAMGIKHIINYNSGAPFIEIDQTGDHFINRLAKDFKKKQDLEIRIDPFNLLQYNNKPIYQGRGIDSARLVFTPYVLLEKSFFRNETVIQAYRLHLESIEATKNKARRYHGNVIGKDVITLDRLKAYGETIRLYAHNALKAPSEGVFNYWFERIKDTDNAEINLSETILKNLDGNSRLESSHSFSDVYQMASFTLTLYSVIGQKLSEKESASIPEKKKFLKQLIHTLSLHDIKTLDGYYPSRTEILAMLE